MPIFVSRLIPRTKDPRDSLITTQGKLLGFGCLLDIDEQGCLLGNQFSSLPEDESAGFGLFIRIGLFSLLTRNLGVWLEGFSPDSLSSEGSGDEDGLVREEGAVGVPMDPGEGGIGPKSFLSSGSLFGSCLTSGFSELESLSS